MSKAYETLLRLQRWQLDEERRRLAELYREQERITLTSEMLERRREVEAAAAGETAHAYPDFAARVRADQARLAERLAEVDDSVAAKQDDVASAYLAMKQVEIVRDKQRTAAATLLARREQARLDELGLEIHRRRGAAGATRA